MAIEAVQGDNPTLRLTGVTAPTQAATPQAPAAMCLPKADTVSFDSIYVANLPKVPITEAHRRLETIRLQLVAGETHIPTHIGSHVSRVEPSNPYAMSASAVLRLTPNPADVNASAVELRSGI